MLDKIVLSQDRRTARLTYTDKRSVRLYSDNAEVVDLVWWVCFKPFESRVETFKQALGTIEDTQVINIGEVSK